MKLQLTHFDLVQAAAKYHNIAPEDIEIIDEKIDLVAMKVREFYNNFTDSSNRKIDTIKAIRDFSKGNTWMFKKEDLYEDGKCLSLAAAKRIVEEVLAELQIYGK